MDDSHQEADHHGRTGQLVCQLAPHHLMFVALRDGGDSPEHLAPSVAAFHGISVDELKAHCRRTGEEWIARDGGLGEINQRVYDWAKC